MSSQTVHIISITLYVIVGNSYMYRKTSFLSKIYLLLFLFLFFVLLLGSSQVVNLALESIYQWLTRILPILFPFMMFHSCMSILGLDMLLAMLFYPILRRIFFTTVCGSYCLVAGFFFGFPMGAKIVSQFYTEKKLSKKEAEVLLGFCNTFSPAYYKGFVYPALLALHPRMAIPCLLGIYLIPLGYGCFLCRTQLAHPSKSIEPLNVDISYKNFLSAFQTACSNNLKAIGMIGAHMLMANVLRSILYVFPVKEGYMTILGSSFEISTGLPILCQSSLLSVPAKITALLTLLSFGGISGLMQAFTFIVPAGLSATNYIKNKIILILLTILYTIFIYQIV